MKRGETGVSQNIREENRKRVSGWSWLGARAECMVWKQEEQCAIAKPEIQLCQKKSSFLHPNVHSHLLPSPRIHHPIHQPLCSIVWPPLFDAATLSNRPDGLSELHPTVYICLNHCNTTALLSYFTLKHCFTSALNKPITITMSLRAGMRWCVSQYIYNKNNTMPVRID